MSNEQVYAAGLLNRALDPATQPPEIRAFLQAEIDLLNDIVVEGMSMIDVGSQRCEGRRRRTAARQRRARRDRPHGWVPEYGESRTFAFERMRRLQQIDERFEPHALPAEPFGNSVGVFSGRPAKRFS